MIALLALAAAIPDPCAPVEPDAQKDPAAAAVYSRFARGEEERSAYDTAAAAWRAAARKDPDDATARAALAALCRRVQEEGRFSEALRLMREGDRTGAIALFEEIRTGTPDAAASLLEGILEYERGEDARARPLFEEAQSRAETADAAALYLGMIALRGNDARLASAFFQSASVSRDPAIGASAARLLPIAGRAGRLVFSFLAAAGGDSNADLAPDGAPTPGGSGDGATTLAASLSYRPRGQGGFYARGAGSYRKLMRFTQYDLGLAQAAAGFQLGPDARSFAGEAQLEALSLGGSPYLLAERLLAQGSWPLGSLSAIATYSARFESFQQAAAAGYSGTRHALEAGMRGRFEEGLFFALGYAAVGDLTRDPGLAYFEHGPRATVRLPLAQGLSLALEGDVLRRTYRTDAALGGVGRADTYFDGTVSGEAELGGRFALRVNAGVRRSLSNVTAFTYLQLTAGLAVIYSLGLL